MGRMHPAPILTVDVEDWFHVCGEPRFSGGPDTWETRVKRVHVGTERLLALLDGSGSFATFFVLGWVARKSPSLVRRIADAGHEVASHGDLHRRLFEMTLDELREDLRRAKGTLEDVLGRAVVSFRAPEWSMRTPANPALAVLVEEGFRVDSSLVPAPPVGLATNPERPTFLATAAGEILEVPPLMGTFFFRRAMLGGGVCSRMSRFARVLGAIDGARARGVPPVLYCHPWELDPEHPPMRLSPVGTLVHFAGRKRVTPRLTRLLGRYRMRPVASLLEPAAAAVNAKASAAATAKASAAA
jgi:polysaccharide deacetylase family protein (PEP-CTERM system associated)